MTFSFGVAIFVDYTLMAVMFAAIGGYDFAVA